jgi:2-polyprenyl-3-methyl-5-hydroxy-6-metoxy-1,4-benzoquinol methylase
MARTGIISSIFLANEREMKAINVDDGIEVRSATTCYLCGAEGQLLYGNLQDRLFGAQGTWNLRKCCNPECDLLWLDPMPTEADLHKVYKAYFTHQVSSNSTDNPRSHGMLLRSLRLVLKIGYRSLLHLTDIQQSLSQAREDTANIYLSNSKVGRLLDVGCGNGTFLDRMRSLGWDVQGVEVDHKAARVAAKVFNIPVFVGTLEEARHPAASLDAITMNHVIEHVHDPIALLQECYRILRPQGDLIVVTPNVRSLGHARFGRHWRGLEPPRHLHLFSPSTLQSSARKAGFRKVETWTTPANAEVLAIGSFDIERGGRQTAGNSQPLLRELLGKYFQLRACLYYWRHSDSGEEVILRASKGKPGHYLIKLRSSLARGQFVPCSSPITPM